MNSWWYIYKCSVRSKSIPPFNVSPMYPLWSKQTCGPTTLMCHFYCFVNWSLFKQMTHPWACVKCCSNGQCIKCILRMHKNTQTIFFWYTFHKSVLYYIYIKRCWSSVLPLYMYVQYIWSKCLTFNKNRNIFEFEQGSLTKLWVTAWCHLSSPKAKQLLCRQSSRCVYLLAVCRENVIFHCLFCLMGLHKSTVNIF